LEPVLGFAGAFLGVWWLCGQELASVGPYLAHSLWIAHGYVDNMGLVASPELLRDAAAVWALLALWLVHDATARSERVASGFDAAVLAVFSSAAWKRGFVRADGHPAAFFIAVLGAALVVALSRAEIEPRSPVRALLLAALAITCLVGIDDTWPESAR